ncbi:MAG: PEGA domain-containing protein [Myxococcota bacterium]
MWLLAGVVASLPRPSVAQGTRITVIVRPVDDSSADAAVRVAPFFGRALGTGSRYAFSPSEPSLHGAAAVRAARDIEEAEKNIRRARDAVEQLRIREATSLLEPAVEVLRQHAAYLKSVDALVEALMSAGALRLLQNQQKAGLELLAEAVTLNPNAKPNAQLFNPPMHHDLRAIVKKKKRAPGKLALTSMPSGGRAFLDGRFVGRTPVELDGLPEGTHMARIVLAGHAAWGKGLDVIGGAEVRVIAKLDPVPRLAAVAKAVDEASDEWGGSGSSAEARVRLAELLDVDQILLVTASGKGKSKVELSASLSTSAGVELARHRWTMPLRGSDAILLAGVHDGLRSMKPPTMSVGIGAVRTTGLRGEAERAVKRAVSDRLSALGAKVSFLSKPMSARCFGSRKCVRRVAAELSSEAIVDVEAKRAGVRTTFRMRVFLGKTGKRIADLQATVSGDHPGESAPFRAAIGRCIDVMWEAQKEADEEPAAVQEPKPETDVAAATESTRGPLTPPTADEAPVVGRRRVLGWALGGSGVVVTAVGIVLVANGVNVWRDPGSSGDSKSTARRLGLVGLGTTVVGAVLGSIGGVIAWNSYTELPPE